MYFNLFRFWYSVSNSFCCHSHSVTHLAVWHVNSHFTHSMDFYSVPFCHLFWDWLRALFFHSTPFSWSFYTLFPLIISGRVENGLLSFFSCPFVIGDSFAASLIAVVVLVVVVVVVFCLNHCLSLYSKLEAIL